MKLTDSCGQCGVTRHSAAATCIAVMGIAIGIGVAMGGKKA
jgi:hypothetical protein